MFVELLNMVMFSFMAYICGKVFQIDMSIWQLFQSQYFFNRPYQLVTNYFQIVLPKHVMDYSSLQSGFQTSALVIEDKIEISEQKASWLPRWDLTHSMVCYCIVGFSPHSVCPDN